MSQITKETRLISYITRPTSLKKQIYDALDKPMKERKYKPSPAEQAQEELATAIHKSLVGQLKPSDTDIIKSLRKESKRCLN